MKFLFELTGKEKNSNVMIKDFYEIESNYFFEIIIIDLFACWRMMKMIDYLLYSFHLVDDDVFHENLNMRWRLGTGRRQY